MGQLYLIKPDVIMLNAESKNNYYDRAVTYARGGIAAIRAGEYDNATVLLNEAEVWLSVGLSDKKGNFLLKSLKRHMSSIRPGRMDLETIVLAVRKAKVSADTASSGFGADAVRASYDALELEKIIGRYEKPVEYIYRSNENIVRINRNLKRSG